MKVLRAHQHVYGDVSEGEAFPPHSLHPGRTPPPRELRDLGSLLLLPHGKLEKPDAVSLGCPLLVKCAVVTVYNAAGHHGDHFMSHNTLCYDSSRKTRSGRRSKHLMSPWADVLSDVDTVPKTGLIPGLIGGVFAVFW